jgi:hypothetical protein
MDSIRLQADDARRLKNDTAFQQFVQDVRDVQISIFTNTTAQEIEQREEAHAIMRALNQIEMQLDAAIAAERMLDRHK